MQLSITLELFSVASRSSSFLSQLTDRCTWIRVVHERGCSRHVERPMAVLDRIRSNTFKLESERTTVGIVDDTHIERE